MVKESNTREDTIQLVCGLGIPRAVLGSMLLPRVGFLNYYDLIAQVAQG
jgi:hypothetical protein